MSNSILYKEIQNNWNVFENKLNNLNEELPKIIIEQLLLKEDKIYIEKSEKDEFNIIIGFRILVENEFSFIRFTSKMILARQLGFIQSKNTKFSLENKELNISYKKSVKSLNELKKLIEKIGSRIRNFKTSIEMKNEALFVYIDGNLNILYPYISEVDPPTHPKIKKIVDKMAEAYWKDYVSKETPEVYWGIRTALKIAQELLKCNPEVIYRILRAETPKYKELSYELYKYLEIVPYTGPGRRRESKNGSCGMAFRIKRENPYISKLMRQYGVPLKIIFPGG